MEQDTKEFLKELIEKQSIKHLPIAVDIILANGNIELKAFRIYEYDDKRNIVKGMTLQEEYAFMKEHRKPVCAIFKIVEIKSIQNSTAGYSYLNELDQVEQLKSI
ncbi:MAG: hypothetical protein U0U66_10990 [Cytophagaceae bacterium]